MSEQEQRAEAARQRLLEAAAGEQTQVIPVQRRSREYSNPVPGFHDEDDDDTETTGDVPGPAPSPSGARGGGEDPEERTQVLPRQVPHPADDEEKTQVIKPVKPPTDGPAK
ncbi:hypothetical protein ACPCHT_20180 [Nucisporomicrobium flavum]|uniref:hypothetical protein n=1 Tax=Nucisporomicrobium flavum TaxID=2785915 RepID=UPI003C2CD724